MKKFILLSTILSTFLIAGPIKAQFDFINKGQSVTLRIERKLDLILQQYIKEEQAAEKRQQEIDSAVNKAKESYKKSKAWLNKKANEVLESEPLINNLIHSDSKSEDNSSN